MDIPYGAWFPEQHMEFPHEFIDQQPWVRPYPDFASSFSPQNISDYENLFAENQSVNATRTSSFAPNIFTVSFGDLTTPTAAKQAEENQVNLNELLGSIAHPKRVSSAKRNPRQAQEHILAERKRREKLTQRFISLSTLLPEVKKVDKATVLEDAIKYIKHLQNRVEEMSISGKYMIQESRTSLRTSKSHDASFFDLEKNIGTNYNPGIKVRIAGSNILVKIYCQTSSLLVVKVLNEMEKLHFNVKCNNTIPISSIDVLIIVTAEMSEEFVMTAMDLMKCLQSSLSTFLS